MGFLITYTGFENIQLALDNEQYSQSISCEARENLHTLAYLELGFSKNYLHPYEQLARSHNSKF